MEHTHQNHTHKHGNGCGHKVINHDGHVDYLHDGHLHFVDGTEIQECALEATKSNPNACTPTHACKGHDKAHKHGSSCGHEAIPHAGHTDYLVDGHLHHSHGDHCDNHGALSVS